jgi:hypothetical protein
MMAVDNAAATAELLANFAGTGSGGAPKG